MSLLQSKAMLVSLEISRWQAIKHDKQISAEVEISHAAKDAGRYNKRLIDKNHLAVLETFTSQVRAYHYAHTLPWSDKGVRMLPSVMFFDYKRQINTFQNGYAQLVDDFLVIYPQLMADAQRRLNTMYVVSDYPDPADVRKLFAITLEITPVPSAADFRAGVADEEAAEIRASITALTAAREQAVIDACKDRIREVVSRFEVQCGNPKGRIHDSLVDNARDLADLLKGLNVMNDMQISTVEQKIRDHLLMPPSLIRTDQDIRAGLAIRAKEILKCLQ